MVTKGSLTKASVFCSVLDVQSTSRRACQSSHQTHLGTHQQRETIPGQIPEQCNKGEEISALVKCPKPARPNPAAQRVKDYTGPWPRGVLPIYILRSCSTRPSRLASENMLLKGRPSPSPEHVPLQGQLQALKTQCPAGGTKAPSN